jgi:hypothetical protein
VIAAPQNIRAESLAAIVGRGYSIGQVRDNLLTHHIGSFRPLEQELLQISFILFVVRTADTGRPIQLKKESAQAEKSPSHIHPAVASSNPEPGSRLGPWVPICLQNRDWSAHVAAVRIQITVGFSGTSLCNPKKDNMGVNVLLLTCHSSPSHAITLEARAIAQPKR